LPTDPYRNGNYARTGRRDTNMKLEEWWTNADPRIRYNAQEEKDV
jgi:hypothetical protein